MDSWNGLNGQPSSPVHWVLKGGTSVCGRSMSQQSHRQVGPAYPQRRTFHLSSVVVRSATRMAMKRMGRPISTHVLSACVKCACFDGLDGLGDISEEEGEGNLRDGQDRAHAGAGGRHALGCAAAGQGRT